MKAHRWIFYFLFLSFFCGCSSLPRVDERTLARLYSEPRQFSKKNPVIFIPGTMGSVLKDAETGRTVWGKVSGGVMDVLALPIDAVNLFSNRDNLVPVRPITRVYLFNGLLEKQVYENLNRLAIEAGGYVLNHNAFALSYDWRRDLVEAAKQLADLIERIKIELNQPDLKVDLLCHSAGGLIARYYIKYGGEDVLERSSVSPTYAGAGNVNKVIMLGTPNSGSLESFQRLHEGLWLPTVVRLKPDVVFTMPSLYELLPYEGEPVFVDRDGLPMDVNIYDPLNWEKYGWSVFSPQKQERARRMFVRKYGSKTGQSLYSAQLTKERRFIATVLERAKKFQQALWAGDIQEEKNRVEYILLGSDCQPTLRKAVLTRTKHGWQTAFKAPGKHLSEIVYGFGDRSVTKDSLLGRRYLKDGDNRVSTSLFPSRYEVFVCVNHADLTKSPVYMDNILHILIDDND